MSKTLLIGTFTLLACVAVAAQAPNQAPPQAPSPAPATAQPSRGDTLQAPASDSSAQSAPKTMAKADTLTIQGCIQRSAQASSATPGATGTAGATSAAFILANAMRPAAAAPSAAASATIASSYRLDADASKLSPHVGHKVEITGTLDASAPAAAPSSPGAAAPPRIKVDNVKMLAASCTP